MIRSFTHGYLVPETQPNLNLSPRGWVVAANLPLILLPSFIVSIFLKDQLEFRELAVCLLANGIPLTICGMDTVL